jgi:hypothetical protein
MLNKWESRWALIRTVAALISVALQATGLALLIHYNHILIHK